MLANRVMMGVFRESGTLPFIPDIAVAPEITVNLISLTLEVPMVEEENISVAPGAVSVSMVPLTYEVPVVDIESIKVAPGAIVVDLVALES